MAKNLAIDDKTNRRLDSLKMRGHYFILRHGDSASEMTQINLTEDQKTFTYNADTLKREHKLHVEKGGKGNRRYKKYNPFEFNVLSEVHVYTDHPGKGMDGKKQLNLNQLQKIEVMQKDKAKTGLSHLLGGIVTGAIIVVGVFAIALAGSGGSLF